MVLPGWVHDLGGCPHHAPESPLSQNVAASPFGAGEQGGSQDQRWCGHSCPHLPGFGKHHIFAKWIMKKQMITSRGEGHFLLSHISYPGRALKWRMLGCWGSKGWEGLWALLGQDHWSLSDQAWKGWMGCSLDYLLSFFSCIQKQHLTILQKGKGL